MVYSPHTTYRGRAMKRAAIRLGASGMSWERWDNFTQDWYPLPLHWTRRDALEFVAGICNVRQRDVQINARAEDGARR